MFTGLRAAGVKEGGRVKRTATAEPLRFSLIDQLPSQGGAATAVNSIEERRRLATFDAALQDVVREGKLKPAVLINNEPDLRSGIGSEQPQPPGTLIVRIFLTQWSQTRLGGSADTEIVCRFRVEEMRDGHRVASLGPFFSRVHDDIALVPSSQDGLATYRTAARQALEQLAAQRLVPR